MRIDSAQRIGVPTFRAARMEEKIVKVPKNEAVIALGQSKPTFAGGIDLEKDLAIDKQGEKLDPWKVVLPTQRLICCGEESTAMAAAICGSQILNNAPARGDSRTISSPRRRIYANRERTRASALPSCGACGQ